MWLEWQDHQEAPVSKPEVSEDDIQANDSSEVTQQIVDMEAADPDNSTSAEDDMDDMMAALEQWAQDAVTQEWSSLPWTTQVAAISIGDFKKGLKKNRPKKWLLNRLFG